MTESDILEIKIKNLKKLKNFSAFSAVFFLQTIPISVLVIISIIAELVSVAPAHSTADSLFALIGVIAFTPLMLWLGVFSYKNNIAYFLTFFAIKHT